jgi:hypothetical protein
MRPPQWVNTAPDEAALPALLQRVAARLPVESIDEVWIFPTRRAAGAESTVIVIAAFDSDDRRLVSTAHFTATRDRKGNATVTEKMEQHASAPAGAVARVVEGVLRRMGDDLALPLGETIGGDAQRWSDLLQRLGGGTAV